MILRFGCINWWSYWNSKTWNKKKQKGRFLGALLAPLAASLVQPGISSVLKGISEKGIRRADRGYMNKKFYSSPCFTQYLDYWLFHLRT